MVKIAEVMNVGYEQTFILSDGEMVGEFVILERRRKNSDE